MIVQHFYQNIEGWSEGIDRVYASMVARAPSAIITVKHGVTVVNKPQQQHFVEVGTWLGKSAVFMAVEIINSGKNIRFDCVDTWQGSDEHQQDHRVQNDTLYREFLKNIEPVRQWIRPVRASSVEAAAQYPDESLDFVFLDADHSYEAVKADIAAWWPKVKKGGIMGGHDYNTRGDHSVGKAVRERWPEMADPGTDEVGIWYIGK